MTIVIMNSNDEVLCVDEYDDVICKPVEMLQPSDKLAFKLIDLTEPTNPGIKLMYYKCILIISMKDVTTYLYTYIDVFDVLMY